MTEQKGLFDQPKKHYDLTKTKDKVKKILDEHPATRNSDHLLIAWYMKTYHNISTLFDWANRTSEVKVSPESIRRVRQKLNEKGLCLPTEEKVLQRRGILIEDFKEFSRSK